MFTDFGVQSNSDNPDMPSRITVRTVSLQRVEQDFKILSHNYQEKMNEL